MTNGNLSIPDSEVNVVLDHARNLRARAARLLAEAARLEEVALQPHPAIVAVCAYWHVSIPLLMSPARSHRIAEARMMVCYILRRYERWPLTKIGRLLNRDHSTVHHGCMEIEKRMAEQPRFAAAVERLALSPRQSAGNA